MLKPSDFNNAVPQFQNGNYASNPINPQYVEEPSSTDYNRGTEPLQTLPAQWWNWFMNKFTSRFNKVNIYVKNLFNELAQLLSLVNVTPDGTEGAVTDGQLKNAFKELYPDYINTKLALESTYVKKTQKVNNHALSGDITISKSDVGLGNVANTGDSANASSGGTTKFTTGGAYNLLSSIAPYFSTSTAYSVGDLITYQNRFYECTTAHSAGAWNASHFAARSVQYIINNYILPSFAPTFSTSTAYVIGDFVTYQNKLYICIRDHSAGAWNDSQFTLTNLNVLPYTQRRIALTNQDLNDIKDNGIYKADGVDSVTNKPSSNLYNWILLVIKQNNAVSVSTDRLVQIMIVLNSREIYYRGYFGISDTWQDWQKLISSKDFASDFSDTTTYAVGDYVTYNGQFYRCTTAHSAGAWNASHFTAVTIGGELETKADQTELAKKVDKTTTVNGHALSGNVTVTKSDVGLGNVANINLSNVVNTGDSATPVSGGTTKFTTGGAYSLLTSLAPIFSTSTSYTVGDMVTYNGVLYTCTTAHSAGAWNASHFTVANLNTEFQKPANNIAEDFQINKTYEKGQLVIYNKELYKCIQTIYTQLTEWDATKFQKVSMYTKSSDRATSLTRYVLNVSLGGVTHLASLPVLCAGSELFIRLDNDNNQSGEIKLEAHHAYTLGVTYSDGGMSTLQKLTSGQELSITVAPNSYLEVSVNYIDVDEEGLANFTMFTYPIPSVNNG